MSTTLEAYLNDLDHQLSSGLPDDFSGTIRNARFGTTMPREGSEPRLALIFDIHTDDADLGNGGVLEEQIMALSEGWKKVGKGESIEREDGKKAAYNNGSKIGRFCAALLAQDSFRESLAELIEAGDPPMMTDAAFFEGLSGHWTLHRSTFKNQAGEDVEYTYYTIDEFTGRDTGTKPAAKKAAKTPAKKAAKAPAKKAEDNGVAATVAQLAEIAKRVIDEGGDHDAFIEAAFEEVDGADTDEVITDLIADPEKVWDKVVEEYEAE